MYSGKSTTNAVILAFAISVGAHGTSLAAPPVVKTVPAVATDPLFPHDTWSGKTITLKGTSDVDGAGIQFSWDPGDGTPAITGSVTDRYVIEAQHAYTGNVGQLFTARLTVTNTGTGESTTVPYRLQVRAQTLPIEVNVAIDEGLWYLHKAQVRSTVDGQDVGVWNGSGNASGYYDSYSAANVLAFEVNGHLETGSAANPYVETVRRGMRQLFTFLTTTNLSPQTTLFASDGVCSAPTCAAGNVGAPCTANADCDACQSGTCRHGNVGNICTTNADCGTFNPDTNGNGIGAYDRQGTELYQGGMFIDAFVASGTPNAVTTTGEPMIVGRTYADIVQDMVDYYAYCQYDGAGGGGWRYGCQDFPDNSANQWAAIGLIPAERNFHLQVPRIVKDWNEVWLNFSQASNGIFGYTSSSPIWGPYAVTPSGMVQMAMDGIGRGDPRWDNAETFIRDNFGNDSTSGPTNALKAYYYGMFSFTKSMLLHDSNGDLIAEPIDMLRSQTPGVAPIDWYAAQTSLGDPTDGVARVLLDGQNADGSWYGHNFDSSQYFFETAWALVMLRRTIIELPPVAVVDVVPNPGVVNGTITLSCARSYHLDPSRAIVSWSWDLNDDGVFGDATGPVATTSFPALGNYPVSCMVSDNGPPGNVRSATATATVNISLPPIAPTANAGGPYLFCPETKPWYLDGSRSVNPDDGLSEAGQPGDSIKAYAWDLDENNTVDTTGSQPNVTDFFTALGRGDYIVSLTVTDNTAASFPSSHLPDQTSTAVASVRVRTSADPECAACAGQFALTATAGAGGVSLSWTDRNAAGYDVLRGTAAGGPYSRVGSTKATSFVDSTASAGIAYYYVVAQTELNGDETCRSTEAASGSKPAVKEDCNNCIDDDGDGLVDYEDPDCCAPAANLEVFSGSFKGLAKKGHGRLRLHSRLGAIGITEQSPLSEDTTIQFRNANGELLCATVGHEHWMRMHGDSKFWDRSGRLAKGLQDGTIRTKKNGTVVFRTFSNIMDLSKYNQSQLQVTVRVGNKCSRGSVQLRTRKDRLVFP